jgi:hypothetical protein
MLHKDTPESRSLAAVVEREAKAATGLNLARRAFWHGGGFGLRVSGAGLGAGLLLAGLGYGLGKAGEGYASIIGNREIAERAAQTTAAMMTQEREEFRAMLAATPLKVEVVAKLADGSQVSLADGGLVGLKSGQLVGLADGQQVTLKGGAVASAPDMRAAIFDPPPQAPDSTLRLDQDRIQPAASAKAAQGAPRSPVFEPRPQLRAISLPAGASAKAGAALPAAPRPAPKLLRQAAAPAPKACQIQP